MAEWEVKKGDAENSWVGLGNVRIVKEHSLENIKIVSAPLVTVTWKRIGKIKV